MRSFLDGPRHAVAPAFAVLALAASSGLAGPGDATEGAVDIDRAEKELAGLTLAGDGAQGGDGASPLLAGWDPENGFHIRDKEDRFRLRIIGRLQARYTYEALDPRGGAGGRDVSAAELERARIGVRGHLFSPRLGYKLEIDAHNDSGDKGSLTDAYIHVKQVLGEGNDLLNLGAGQFKPPFLRQQMNSSRELQLVDRSLVTEFFNVDRNVGLWVDGECDRFVYKAALTNGFNSENRSPTNVDHSPALILRGEYNILRDGEENLPVSESDIEFRESPAWTVAVAYATDSNNGTATTQINPGGDPTFEMHMLELDSAFRYMGLSLQGEYAMRWLNYDANAPTPRGDGIFAHGFYLQGGYFVVPQTFEVAMRGAFLWSDGIPQKGRGVEIGPGATWFIAGNHNVKLTADVLWVDISPALQHPTENVQSFGALASSSTGLTAGDQGFISRVQMQLAW